MKIQHTYIFHPTPYVDKNTARKIVSISNSRRHFLKDGKHFLGLASNFNLYFDTRSGMMKNNDK